MATEMKIVIGVTAALLTTAAAAQEKQKVVGNWFSKIQQNDFSDDNSVVVLNPHEEAKMAALAVRCVSKELGLVVMAPKQGYSKGDTFTVKVRADRGDITTVRGAAISEEGMIMAPLAGDVLKSFYDAKAIAVRLEEDGGSSLNLRFASGKNREALAPVAKECDVK